MVDFYDEFSRAFTVDMQPHYIYSPRELTRWKLAMAEALEGGKPGDEAVLHKAGTKSFNTSSGWAAGGEGGGGDLFGGGGRENMLDIGRIDPEDVDEKIMIRIYVHEGLRIFSDRLVHEKERKKTDQMIDQITLR